MFKKNQRKKINDGPFEMGCTHTKMAIWIPPPYGPFLHTHPQNVTLLGGPSNAIKRVPCLDFF